MAAPTISIPRRFQRYWNATVKREAEPARSDEQQPAEPPPNPLRSPDGSRVGLRRYCEIVTPAWDWSLRHLVVLDDVYDAVLDGTIKRLIVELPTRIGKTEKGVRFLSYAMEDDPTMPIIVGAYNDPYARRLSRKVRRLVQGRIPLSKDRNAAAEWETEAGGGVRAAGVGVGIAGLPAKGLYIDDPTKSREEAYSKAHRDRVWEWYAEDAYTRLEPDGWIVICMARRHEDDLVGRILASEDADSWTVVRLPALSEGNDAPEIGREIGEALWPARFSEAYYAQMRRAQGEAAFASLQQQRPAPAKGFIFQSDWFRYYTTKQHPIIEQGLAVPFISERLVDHMISVDCSFKDKAKSDFVAGLGGARHGADVYLSADHFHDRLSFPKTLEAIRWLLTRIPAKLKLVEDKANGPAVIATMRSEITGLVGVEPEGDKVSRAHAVTHILESGNFWLPHPAIAPWVKSLVLELLQFPMGAHDDRTDALTQMLRRFDKIIIAEARARASAKSGSSGGGSFRTYGA